MSEVVQTSIRYQFTSVKHTYPMPLTCICAAMQVSKVRFRVPYDAVPLECTLISPAPHGFQADALVSGPKPVIPLQVRKLERFEARQPLMQCSILQTSRSQC